MMRRLASIGCVTLLFAASTACSSGKSSGGTHHEAGAKDGPSEMPSGYDSGGGTGGTGGFDGGFSGGSGSGGLDASSDSPVDAASDAPACPDGGQATKYYKDNDQDGFGDPNASTFACSPPPGFVANHADCNDNNPNIHGSIPGPDGGMIGVVKEQCDNQDDNCDGVVDGYKGINSSNPTPLQRQCYPPPGNPSDLNRPNAICKAGTQICQKGVWQSCTGAVFPKTETCDGKDDDCDGVTDNLKNSSVPESLTRACTLADAGANNCQGEEKCQTGGTWGACSASSSPETCNGLDDNCDGIIDNAPGGPAYSLTQSCNNCGSNRLCSSGTQSCYPSGWTVCNASCGTTYYLDADNDGYGSSTTKQFCPGESTAGYVTNSQDCNDSNGSIHPGATEKCDGADDNCDKYTDNVSVAELDLERTFSTTNAGAPQKLGGLCGDNKCGTPPYWCTTRTGNFAISSWTKTGRGSAYFSYSLNSCSGCDTQLYSLVGLTTSGGATYEMKVTQSHIPTCTVYSSGTNTVMCNESTDGQNGRPSCSDSCTGTVTIAITPTATASNQNDCGEWTLNVYAHSATGGC